MTIRSCALFLSLGSSGYSLLARVDTGLELLGNIFRFGCKITITNLSVN